MEDLRFIRCPSCGSKTRDKIRTDAELKNFPLFCPKCKLLSLIDAKDMRIIPADGRSA